MAQSKRNVAVESSGYECVWLDDSDVKKTEKETARKKIDHTVYLLFLLL